MLFIENLEKSYHLQNGSENNIFKGINLKLSKGEFVTILGESGSGKSTLLNILGGLDLDFKGQYTLEGKSSNEIDWDNFRKEKIGFVFQNFNLISNLSVLENVELAMTIKGISKIERLEKAKGILIKIGLEEHLEQKPDLLSGGEKQRVAIARALVNNPDIILADEPTGQLDTSTAKEILDLLKELGKDKLIIMASHMEEFAREYSSRIIRIADGRLIEEETLKTLGITDESNYEEHVPSKCTNSDLFSLAFKNVLSRKRLMILILMVMVIGMSAFTIVLGLGIAQRENLDQIISQKYDSGKFIIYTHSSLYTSYKEQLESIDSIQNIYFVTMLMPIFDFNPDEDISNQMISGNSGSGELELETYMVDIHSDIAAHITAGKYPENKGEILIGRKTAFNLVYDYYDRNLMDKSKINALSDSEILTEIEKINISFFTETYDNCSSCYDLLGIKYLRFFNNNLTVSGIVNDDKIETTGQHNTSKLDFGPYTARLFVTKDLFYEIENQYHDKPAETDISDYYSPVAIVIETKSNDYQLRLKTIKEVLSINHGFVFWKGSVDFLYDDANKSSLFTLNIGITFGLVIFAISATITGGLIFTNMRKRKREFGTLFALGINRKTLKRLLIFEGMILSILGLILTSAISMSIRYLLNDYYNHNLIGNQKLDFVSIKWYIILMTFILLMAAFVIPVRKFKKLSIIDALREE